MWCDINIARVKEGEAVIGSAHIAAHVLLKGRLLLWEAVVAFEGLVELRFALVL
jgi:hypothetical protein